MPCSFPKRPYTEVDATGAYGTETVTLPSLSSSAAAGNFNGVVIADAPAAFAPGQLSALYSYESTFSVRQVDGYIFPGPSVGLTDVTGGGLDNTTAQLTAAGKATFPELKGPVPIDAGTYGYGASVNVGAPFTPLLEDAANNVLAGIYQHPSTDAQSGVAELAMTFNYNSSSLQWLLLAPGLINWVTNNTHLGLYRNYFGQDIDDTFISDNSWSSTYQCTPGATDPPDYTCPAGVANNPADTPPDVQMSAADVAYVVAWEKQTGITLNLAFNAIGACTAPSAGAATSANCGGSTTVHNTTYTDPGQVVDASYPNDQGLIDAFLSNQADFNWINHTWSHQFLGCNVWQPQPLSAATPNATGGSFVGGTYNYEITAATSYGESEPSLPHSALVGSNGSVTLTWPDATNGVGQDGTTKGPTLAQEEATFSGGPGFWGYNIYRENPASTTYGLVGQVKEDPTGATVTYSFTDTGAVVTPGQAPGSSDTFPTATDPGIDCAAPSGSWEPATSATADSSIEQEIGLNDAFAANNGLTNFTPSDVVTGEHAGLENPNVTKAFSDTGITTFASDASRQPQSYGLGAAVNAPRYPSNIYYNAANWPDELNEYSTIYASSTTSIGNGQVGHCVNTSSTTCVTTAPTEASILASESHIMLSHVLANDPRVGFAHQTNLIGPATQNGSDYGYTILALINDMLSQYKTWYVAPLVPITDTSEAADLAEQATWAKAVAANQVSASETNGVVTVQNTGATTVSVPATMPTGTTVNGVAFGQSYGGTLSGWTSLVGSAALVLSENVGATITSASSATSIVGAPFSFTVSTTGSPTPAITETGALPSGLSFVDNGNGSATIAGTAQATTGGSYLLSIGAQNASGGAAQAFTLTNAEAPTITSASTANFSTGLNATYTVTTTGYPAPSITETGALPSGLSFVDNGNGTATISGSATATAATYPLSIAATNLSGSTATLTLALVLSDPSPPAITSPATAYFTLGQSGSFAVTATGSPIPAINATGSLPNGLTFVDGGNGTATLSGTPTTTGTTTLGITAANIISSGNQSLSVIVGQAPSLTSAASTAFVANRANSFTVTTTGYPAPSLGESGALPSGITFVDNGNGTATIAGTAAPTDLGSYPLNLTAVNSTGTTTQAFTIVFNQAPAITSAASTSFVAGVASAFTVTTTGYPISALSATGALPSGVTFKDNGNGTATIAGTPPAGSGGTYPVSIHATNGITLSASQSFTLGVAIGNGPVITSAATATATVGTPFSFSFTATGTPMPTITHTGTLPRGLAFANGIGSAKLSGTPTAGGVSVLTITAKNTAGTATQSFTITVNAAPKITSAAKATATAGTAFSFAVTTTGTPAPVISATGLPSGLSLADNGNGTAKISGTPAPGSGGTYPVSLAATNTAGTGTQTLTITVRQAPVITSVNAANGAVGTPFSFTFRATGTPTPTITRTGTLPKGLTFTSGTGSATLVGTPTAGGVFSLTITARDAAGTTTQAFTVTIAQTPSVKSKASATATAGTPFSFAVTTTGSPAPSISATGLPSGLALGNNGNGTGTITGIPAPGTGGTYAVTITATSTSGTGTQHFTLTVRQAPSITSASNASGTVGQPFSFTITTSGSPVPTLTRSGTLPKGVTFTKTAGTATFAGTPTIAGTYLVTIVAKNVAGASTQTLTISIS